jgi:phosphoribosyl 1,2-cyclic phosphodiesterase
MAGGQQSALRAFRVPLGGDNVPRFLDMHIVPPDQVTPDILAELHRQDLAVQHKYGVRYVKYWYDAATGRVFCLSDAPTREAALAVHREAHGSMPDDIFEVEEFD